MSIERQILEELVLMRWIMVGTFFAVFLGILFFIVVMAFRVRQMNSQALLRHRDLLIAEVALLEAKGKYEEMLVSVNDVVAAYPNDLMANWYRAIANWKTGNPGAALSALGRIKEINSVWSKGSVDEFVAEIRSQMDGPRAHDA